MLFFEVPKGWVRCDRAIPPREVLAPSRLGVWDPDLQLPGVGDLPLDRRMQLALRSGRCLSVSPLPHQIPFVLRAAACSRIRHSGNGRLHECTRSWI